MSVEHRDDTTEFDDGILSCFRIRDVGADGAHPGGVDPDQKCDKFYLAMPKDPNNKLQMSMSIAVLACYLFHSVQGAVLPATNYNYTRVSIGDRLARDFQVTIVA